MIRMKMKAYLSGQRVRGGLVGGEEGTGELGLIGEGGGAGRGEVPPNARSPRTREVWEPMLTGIGRS